MKKRAPEGTKIIYRVISNEFWVGMVQPYIPNLFEQLRYSYIRTYSNLSLIAVSNQDLQVDTTIITLKIVLKVRLLP